jgi:hypothetical protein
VLTKKNATLCCHQISSTGFHLSALWYLGQIAGRYLESVQLELLQIEDDEHDVTENFRLDRHLIAPKHIPNVIVIAQERGSNQTDHRELFRQQRQENDARRLKNGCTVVSHTNRHASKNYRSDTAFKLAYFGREKASIINPLTPIYIFA